MECYILKDKNDESLYPMYAILDTWEPKASEI